MKRSFRIFATKEDLEDIFMSLQQDWQIYYVPTYSDHPLMQIKDLLSISGFGINTTGRKIGNHQFLIFLQGCSCHWRELKIKDTTRKKYTALNDENNEGIFVDLGGLYNNSILFPTEVSTIHYENEFSNQLFKALKRIVRENTSIIQNGYIICKNAYEQRKQYRFCTINAKSPKEYDLVIEEGQT